MLLVDLKLEFDEKRPHIPRLEVEMSDFQVESFGFEGFPVVQLEMKTAHPRTKLLQ